MTPQHHPLDQNVISGVAIVAPAVSFWVNAPGMITVIVGTLGILWYIVMFSEKIVHYVRKYNRSREV